MFSSTSAGEERSALAPSHYQIDESDEHLSRPKKQSFCTLRTLILALGFLLAPAAIGYLTARVTIMKGAETAETDADRPALDRSQVGEAISIMKNNGQLTSHPFGECAGSLPALVSVVPYSATWFSTNLGEAFMNVGQRFHFTDGASAEFNIKVAQGTWDLSSNALVSTCMQLQHTGMLLYAKNAMTGMDYFYNSQNSKSGIFCEISTLNLGLRSVADIDCIFSKKAPWTVYSALDPHHCDAYGKVFHLWVGSYKDITGAYSYLQLDGPEWKIADYTNFNQYIMTEKFRAEQFIAGRVIQQLDVMKFQWSEDNTFVAVVAMQTGFQQEFDPFYFPAGVVPTIWRECTYASYQSPVYESLAIGPNGEVERVPTYWRFVSTGRQIEAGEPLLIPLFHQGTYFFADMSNLPDPDSVAIPKGKLEQCSRGLKVSISVAAHATYGPIVAPEDKDGTLEGPTEEPDDSFGRIDDFLTTTTLAPRNG